MSSTDEWIKKLWYIHTMEYYLVIQRNAFESVLMRWMNLEPIIQREVSQKEKDKYCILTYIYTESRRMVPKNSFTGQQWEKEMTTHSSTLAWRIPGTEQPGGLTSMGSHRVGHD